MAKIKNKMQKITNFLVKAKKGSGLAYSLIVVAMMMVIAGEITLVNVVEEKGVNLTESYIQTYQTAEGGSQLAFKKLKDALVSNPSIRTLFVAGDVVCNNGKVSGFKDAGSGEYSLSFYTDNDGSPGNEITDCDETIDSIKSIKTIGVYKKTEQTKLALAPVAAPAAPGMIEENADLVLVFDYSGSINATEIVQMQQAAKNLIDRLDSGYHVGVVFYQDAIVGNMDLTTDKAAVKTFIEGMDDPDEDTDTGLAIEKAVEILNGPGNRSATNHQAIVLVTDGVPYEDTGSGDTYEDGDDSRPHTNCYGESIHWDITKANTALVASDIAKDDEEITIFTIGIGLDIANLTTQDCVDNATTLMSSISSSGNYIPIETFGDLDGALEMLVTTGFPACESYTYNCGECLPSGTQECSIATKTPNPCSGGAIPQYTQSCDFCGGVSTVDYGGQTYHVAKIGNQCWLQENINAGTMLANVSTNPSNDSLVEKWCYGDNIANCATYGGLYTWSEANGLAATCLTTNCTAAAPSQGICPDGWHVPSDAEWQILDEYLTDPSKACSPASSRSGSDLDSTIWSCDGAGTRLKNAGINKFSALLGGYRCYRTAGTECASTSTQYYNTGAADHFWTSNKFGSVGTSAYKHRVDSSASESARVSTSSKRLGLSVRCIQN